MVNKVIMIGRLTRDPEIRILPSGTEVVSTGLAVSRYYKHDEQLKEEVYFFEIEEYCGKGKLHSLSKGDKIYVEGHLRQFKTEKGNYIRIVVEKVEVLKKKQVVPVSEKIENEEIAEAVDF